MKKSIFILAALLATTFANAQITLEHAFDVYVEPNYFQLIGSNQYITDDEILFRHDYDTKTVTIYDAITYDLITELHYSGYLSYFAKNLFTADNSYAVLCSFSVGNGASHWYVYDASGQNVIADLGVFYGESVSYIFNSSTGYKLAIGGKYESISAPYGTRIYSLPGSGATTDISDVSAPRHYNVHKYLHNDQVLIDSNDRTYNMQGLEVK